MAQGLGLTSALGRRPQLAPYLLLLSPDPGGFRPSQEAKDALPLPHAVLELIPRKTYFILGTIQTRCLEYRPRCRQEDQEFRIISGYIGSSRQAWAT